MQENTSTTVVPEALDVPAQSRIEVQLAKEIGELWSAHQKSHEFMGHTKQELQVLRLELGQRLYKMKVLLACPGRAGQWSKFLSEQRIPRASADRYAKSYQISLNPPAEIDSSESIQDSPDQRVQMVMQSIWPKLHQVLADQEISYQFLCALVQRCDTLQAEITDSGIVIRKPTTISSDPCSGVLETHKVDEGQSVEA